MRRFMQMFTVCTMGVSFHDFKINHFTGRIVYEQTSSNLNVQADKFIHKFNISLLGLNIVMNIILL